MAFFCRFTNLLKHQYIRGISSAPNTKLKIGGFSCSTDEQSLREAFSKYGEIVDARISMNPRTGKRHGFITYNSDDEASIALRALDGRDIYGNQVKVDYVAVMPLKDNGVYKLLVPSPLQSIWSPTKARLVYACFKLSSMPFYFLTKCRDNGGVITLS